MFFHLPLESRAHKHISQTSRAMLPKSIPYNQSQKQTHDSTFPNLIFLYAHDDATQHTRSSLSDRRTFLLSSPTIPRPSDSPSFSSHAATSGCSDTLLTYDPSTAATSDSPSFSSHHTFHDATAPWRWLGAPRCKIDQGNLLELVDPCLGSKYSKEEAEKMLNIALLCTNM